MAMNERSGARETYWPLALLLAVLVYSFSWFYVHNVPVGDPPDEWAHLGYISDVAISHHLMPDYKNSKILNSRTPNYLTHPPLYYTMEGLWGRVMHWDPRQQVSRYRAISALWVSLGVYLWVLTCGELGLVRERAFGLVAACLAVPMFTYLAGSVNNDDLCYLGVAVFCYGFARFHNHSMSGAYIAALGVVITLLTKATGALFIVAFLLSWAVLARKEITDILNGRHIRIAVVGATVFVLAYYVPTLLVYHTPFPHPGVLQRKVMAPDPAMGFLKFSMAFASYMADSLPIILSHDSSSPIPKRLIVWFYIMIALPLVAWLVGRPFARSGWIRHFGDAFLIALIVTIFANILVSWRAYQQLGQLVGVQPRYYGFVLPGVFIIGFAQNARLRRTKSALLLIFMLIGAVLIARIPFRSALDHIYGVSAKRYSTITAQENAGSTIALRARTDRNNAGYIDSAYLTGKDAIISGWAIDVPSKRAARGLLISLRGRILGMVRPTSTRPDVADALDAPGAEMSGFSVIVQALPNGVSPCDLTIQVEQDDGSLAPITQGACQRQ